MAKKKSAADLDAELAALEAELAALEGGKPAPKAQPKAEAKAGADAPSPAAEPERKRRFPLGKREKKAEAPAQAQAPPPSPSPTPTQAPDPQAAASLWKREEGAWVRAVPGEPRVVRRVLDENGNVVREEPADARDVDAVTGVKAERAVGKLLGRFKK